MTHETNGHPSLPAQHRRDAPASASLARPPVRVLLVDDGDVDAEPHRRELERAQFEVCRRMASTARELVELFLEQPFDAIVCDNTMRRRMSMEALVLIRKRDPDVPFIVLIDTLDMNDVTQEDVLTEFMLRGATDCVDKKRLGMLSVAVAFAVEERILIAERNRIDQELDRSRARYQALSVGGGRRGPKHCRGQPQMTCVRMMRSSR